MDIERVSAFWPRGLPRDLHVPHTTLFENLEIAARRYPDKAALVFYDSQVSFATLRTQAERLAGYLQQRCRVRAGDRVLLFAQNCPQFIAAYHAILRADAIVVLANAMNRSDELRHAAQEVQARVIVAGAELMPQVMPLLGEELDLAITISYADAVSDRSSAPDWLTVRVPPIDDVRITGWEEALQAGCAPAAHAARPEDDALIAFTSGTSGRPKGCLHTHRSVMTGAVTSALWRNCHPESVILGVAPMFHLLGLQVAVNAPAYLGATTVLMARWDAAAAVSNIAQYGVTHWGAPPTMVSDLLLSPLASREALASLQQIGSGGGVPPEAVVRRLRDELGVQMVEGWGMTETAAMAIANPPARSKPQCLGIPTFGVQVRLLDPATGEEVAEGEVGEILVHGAQVMSGYWNHPEANEETFVTLDGLRFLRTGDLARRDAEGYYFMVDRLKRMIVVSGYKVWPAEVESALHRHPAVQEACVVGVPQARSGEQVLAVIVLKSAERGRVDASQISEWLRERLSAYKCPRQFEFTEALPRMATGKIDWRRLQDAARVAAEAPTTLSTP